MRAIGTLLRSFTFLFNFVLSLGLFFLALIVMPSGKHNIALPPVPLKGSTLTYTLLGGALFGFVAMVLALRRGRGARAPMFVWNLAVFTLLLWTPLRSSFSFESRDQAMTSLYVLIAALLALLGSWRQWRCAGLRRG